MLYFDMLRSTPILAIKKANDDPPALIKGRGKPVAGIEEVTTAMLIAACNPITAVIPDARRQPNKSGAVRAILIPLHIRTRNSIITSAAPTKPNSSPMIENIKSVSA